MNNEAHRVANRKYYESHAEQIKAKARRVYRRKREEAIARSLRYYYANRERILSEWKIIRNHGV